MANTIKQPKKEKKRRGFFSRLLTAILNGEFLTKKGLISFMPFIAFLTILFLINIGMGYYFENTLRDLVRTKRQLEEYKSEYNTIQSQLENKKQQSTVIHDIENLGLEAAHGEPVIIEVKPGSLEE